MLSIVLPAKNESATVARVVGGLCAYFPDAQVIVVDDGSTDGTGEIAATAGAKVVTQPYSKGNGAAIKRGALAAKGDVLVFMDADGQHDPADVERLLYKYGEGYDLVVGARSGLGSQASVARWGANSFYNKFASWMVGQPIDDLTSGFRAVNRKKFLSFLYLLPNGFSYPTTSTMAFYRAGYSVAFLPIKVAKRQGSGHISLLRDGLRFLLIIFKVGTLYSPLKVYFPFSVLTAGLGVFNYVATAIMSDSWRFTNMTALLVSSGVIMFLLGLLSEQLTNLQYKDVGVDED
ncbi:glycosyltransferase family 2 protein [Congregibacter variabilis]|uniref:Glycosyltransferase family 2 protein n=1 Tax=Congregibacter variabilis TaxID=3081200 RepID=A0ABZ0IA21_9GAMM|nr:glycosyltransferase family 2 protein [Congregibacter sp. IMCC43200]